MKRYYYYTGIENTPFTLVVALPDRYGLATVHAQVEVRRLYNEGQYLYLFYFHLLLFLFVH